jgi:transcriptional regulator with GAF, ATPase, and Fis domain
MHEVKKFVESTNQMTNNDSKKTDLSLDSSIPIQKDTRALIFFQKMQGAMRNLPDFVETCKAILNVVIEETDAENCSLMIKDPKSGALSIRAARGKNEGESVYYPEHSSNGNGKQFKPGEGIAGWVLKEGQAVMLNDVKEEPRFVKTIGLNNNVRSLLCFPIEDKDQVVGVFNLSHSKKGAFDDWDKLALAYISNQVGTALTSARFFLEIKETPWLKKDLRDALSLEKTDMSSVARCSTFIEVGEMNSDNEMFIYTSDKMHRIKEVIDHVANTDVTVFIQGESGVGKEVVARSIHLNSSRRDKPFVKVNCAALPNELIESELFGYDKGAFTGAYRQKAGKFELAQGGTIFLDEISEIGSALQAKLLQVLQDKQFPRLGGQKDVKVDVRILTATNTNIEEAVKNGRFREDLFYRLNVVNINVPPLRERKEEIPVFIQYFLYKFSKKYNKKVKPLPDQLIKKFIEHPWLGNVREMENLIQRLVVLGHENLILEEMTPVIKEGPIVEKMTMAPDKRSLPSLKEVNREALTKAESEIILKSLEKTNWNRKKTANILNISYKALLYKIKAFGLERRCLS